MTERGGAAPLQGEATGVSVLRQAVAPDEFKEAMARLVGAVSIVATDGPAGRYGRTVSSACSVTAEPPSLLVCIDRSAEICGALAKNGSFALSVLGCLERGAAQLFAGKPKRTMEERFRATDWIDAAGAPVLRRADTAFVCALSEAKTIATHRIFVGTVVETRFLGGDLSPLVYFDREYKTLKSL